MLPSIDNHNQFYLAENRREEPKEYFKFLLRLAGARLAFGSPRVLDVGCATGDFLHYLHLLYPAVALTGLDVTSEFVAKAKYRVPTAEFLLGDIYSGANLPSAKFDLVFMSGVNYLFTQWEPWIRNIISLTRGTAFVFGVFNPEELDVRATVQRPGHKSATPWNLISEKSVSSFLDRLNVTHQFVRWELPTAIPRSNDDPLRSWTVATSDGPFLVINGTQVVHRFAALEIDVKTEGS
jgi:SAM-dependent methyltransferase